MTVAVITGAAGGIGAGLARHAASKGMNLVLADWDETALKAVADSLLTDVLAVQTDVRDESAVEALAKAAYDKFGEIDLVFNNAGVLSSGLTWEIDAATWQRSLDINIGGVINVIRTFIPRMMKAECQSRIINTSSLGGFLASPFMAPYTATKFAIVGISEALAGDLAAIGSHVEVSLLAPGPVKSGILDETAPAKTSDFMTMMRDMTEEHGMSPDEFAPLVFEAIERGEYWITPHAEMLDTGLQERMDMILERKHPTSVGLVDSEGGHNA